MGLSSGKVLRLTVFAYYQRVTDGQTDRRNCYINIARCIHQWMQTTRNENYCRGSCFSLNPSCWIQYSKSHAVHENPSIWKDGLAGWGLSRWSSRSL